MHSAVSEMELELAPGERLLWSGKPQSGVRLQGKDLILIPLGLMWLGFSLFWEFMVLRLASPQAGPMRFIFALFGIPFLLIGIYLVIGRFFFESRKRAQTAYGITDKRALIVTRARQRRVRSLDLGQITDMELVERPDGSGAIRFLAAGSPAYAKVGHEQRVAIPRGSAFEFVPRVREVYDVLHRARNATGQAG